MSSELWYNTIGFFNNPFSIKPAAFHDEVVGYELDEVFSKIESGNAVFIQGPMGVGKTTMLKHILSRFGGKGKVIYCSANTSDRKISFRQLLVGGSFLNRILSLPSSDMILLVDEAQEIKKQESREILRLFRKGNFRSVVFFGTDYPGEKLVPELHEAMKSNIKVLSRLKAEDAVTLVRNRIGDLPFVSDETIKKIYRLSDYNPRKLLENCEDIFKYAVDQNAKHVSDFHIKAVIKEAKKKAKSARQRPPKQKVVIEQIEEVSMEPLNVHHNQRKQNYGRDYNIRTYEEEMETIKQDLNDKL
ncbi:AAA family ATPase [Candidatus Woesearchaeota archaeon]|nr:AAA family ATPase [Candidatus Woesearchaeota archaeon]